MDFETNLVNFCERKKFSGVVNINKNGNFDFLLTFTRKKETIKYQYMVILIQEGLAPYGSKFFELPYYYAMTELLTITITSEVLK